MKLIKASTSKYAFDQDYRLRMNEARHLKYKLNVLYRNMKKRWLINQYKCNQTYRTRLQESANVRYQKQHNTITLMLRQKYRINMIYNMRKNHLRMIAHARKAAQENAASRRYHAARQKDHEDIEEVIRQFKDACKQGPDYVCCVCHRLLFKDQVKVCYPDKLTKNVDLTERCVANKYLHTCSNDCPSECRKMEGPNGKLRICHTCLSHLSQGSMPPQAYANNLELEPIPEELKDMNSLTQQLLAQTIPFAKIVNLPVGKQKGIRGPVVCVPSNISVTSKVLPRLLTEADIIGIKLKRKLSYAGYTDYKQVNISRVQAGLQYLKEHNPLYRDVTIDPNWADQNSTDDLNILLDTRETSGDVPMQEQAHELSDEDNNESYNQENSDHLRGVENDTCLQAMDFNSDALAELENCVVSIAPAEGNKPVPIFKQGDEDREALSFPTLFPTAKNTFNQERERHLTLSKYLNARLLGSDTRFAQNTQYVFFAQYAKELNQLLSNISIAMRRGATKSRDGKTLTAEVLSNTEELQKIFKADAGYRNLPTLRGSPEYWRRTMNDLFATIRQLGLPTFFFTFSAAELSRWWPEVIETIAKQNGKPVNFNDTEFEDRCEIIRSNPVSAVRIFYQRVNEFITHVIKSPAAPVGKVVDHFYRVEFQQRGAPHIHCLFWIENAPVYDKDDDDTIARFVDQYISCKLPDPVEDPELHDIVSNVQIHKKKHTPSCKKGNKTCRFNFPKCVTKETFVNRPNHGPGESASDEEKKDTTKKQRK